MSKVEKMRLIEKKFPLPEVNTVAECEMSFKMLGRDTREHMLELLGVEKAKWLGLPKINNIAYYPARRPASATRAVSLASVLEENISLEEFKKAVGFENMEKLSRKNEAIMVLSMVDPERELIKKLLSKDPKNVVVVDPMAGGGSIPLEALRLGFTTIAGDFNPLAYLLLRATIEFPAKYGRKLYHLVEEEARRMIEYARKELGRFYGENDKGYIFFRATRHDCGGILPILRTGALNHKKGLYISFDFDKDAKVPVPIISNKQSPPLTTCPYCGRAISEKALQTKWVEEHIKLLEALLSGDESVADKIMEVYILSAVQEGGKKRSGRGYRIPTYEDLERVKEAARELARMAKRGELHSLLPLAEIPSGNEVFEKVREAGLRYWYQLFSPRQLIALAKLTAYVRQRSMELKNKYGELGIAVTLYLALALAKLVNFNSILTEWDAWDQSIRDLAGSQYALGKSVRLGFDFCEAVVPYVNLPWILEAEENEEEEDENFEETRGGILPVLKMLCSSLEGLWRDESDKVYLWDATKIDNVLSPTSVDLVHVDPPYYEQHDYAGISEFFWVIVQQTLLPLLEQLFPEERVKIQWDPHSPEIPRHLEIRGKPPKQLGVMSTFGAKMTQFLKAISKVLKQDGLLVMWYSYGKLHGWEELFYRFYEAGYSVSKTWQIWAESRQRFIATYTKAFFSSIVIVARPNAKRIQLLSENSEEFKQEVRRTVKASLDFIVRTYGLEHLNEAMVTGLADGFAVATRFELLGQDNVFPTYYQRLTTVAIAVSVESMLEYLAEYAGASALSVGTLDPVTRLYTFLLLAASDDRHVSYDFANRVAQALRSNVLNVVTASSGNKDTSVLLLLPDNAKFPQCLAKDAYLFMRDLAKIISEFGVRAGEDRAREIHRQISALTYYYTFFAWKKLGFTEKERESLLAVLRGVHNNE
jgi:adenine-specific DNA methylase